MNPQKIRPQLIPTAHSIVHFHKLRWNSGLGSAKKLDAYKDPVIDPSMSQPLLVINAQKDDEGTGPPALKEQFSTKILDFVPFEECPLNKYSPEFDEYIPILSEDEMSGRIEEEQDFSDASDDDHHCDLLVSAINGEYQQHDVISSQGLSPRKYNPSYRLTRSKAAGTSTTPPNSKPPF